jgi:hypothetical protein
VGLPKTDKYWLEIHPTEGQSYHTRIVEIAGNEGLKPITANFELDRGVALRLRFVDTEKGKLVFGSVHWSACFDSASFQEARRNNHLLHEYQRPDQDGVFSFVVVPGPSIIVFAAGFTLNGQRRSYEPAQLNPEDLKAHPGVEKLHVRLGGLEGIDQWNAYRLIDAQISDKPLTLDIPVRPKH